MKVQCGHCPAKYAVSDERIREKKVRIHCKRCNASIVVDGKVDPPLVTSTPARPSVRAHPSIAPGRESSVPEGNEREQDSQPSPRPVAHTILGGLEAPSLDAITTRPSAPSTLPPEPTGMPAPTRGFTDPPVGGTPDRWRVALTKQDLRWMTTEEIVEAYAAGAVQTETFVFRTGMPHWVTLIEVPEIARALGEEGDPGSANGSARPSSIPPPRRAPGFRPPPRKPQRSSTNEAEAGHETTADDEGGDPLPFALVSERASAAKKDAVSPASSSEPALSVDLSDAQSALGSAGASAEAAPLQEPVPPHPFQDAASANPAPFAANVLAQPSSGSRLWLWIIILLALALAAAAVLGPRFGFKLF